MDNIITLKRVGIKGTNLSEFGKPDWPAPVRLKDKDTTDKCSSY